MSSTPYGPEHRAERERLRPDVEAGRTHCAELVCLVEQDRGEDTPPDQPGRWRWIEPGTPWDLAHDHTAAEGWRGPAHARCNRSEGGKRNRARKLGSLWSHL